MLVKELNCSTALFGSTHLRNLEVLGSSLLEDALVGKSRQGRSDVVLLAHLEVLAEVLVTAPPVEMDHADTLITAHLMEVGVPDIVLDPVDRESAIAVQASVSRVGLTDAITPVLNHLLLLVLDHHIEEEAAPQVEHNHAPHESHTILHVEGLSFPVGITDGVLEETGNVFESSPSLSIISRFLGVVDKLAEVAISVLSQRSIYHDKCTKIRFT